MKVVGAGFGRTGTLTLKVALEKLGLGPCYHMAEVLQHPEHSKTWLAASRGEPVDWAAFFQGWGATVDWPGCNFYKEILAAHPDARVLLSVRDPDKWYQSCLDTIYQTASRFPMNVVGPHLPRVGAVSAMAREVVWKQTFQDRFGEKEHAIAVYKAHIEEVKRSVPADRLLVFEARQGWEPLCAFLGVPVPDEPFPHVNDSASMAKRFTAMNAVSWAILAAPVVAVAWAVAWWYSGQCAI